MDEPLPFTVEQYLPVTHNTEIVATAATRKIAINIAAQLSEEFPTIRFTVSGFNAHTTIINGEIK